MCVCVRVCVCVWCVCVCVFVCVSGCVWNAVYGQIAPTPMPRPPFRLSTVILCMYSRSLHWLSVMFVCLRMCGCVCGCGIKRKEDKLVCLCRLQGTSAVAGPSRALGELLNNMHCCFILHHSHQLFPLSPLSCHSLFAPSHFLISTG